MYDVLKRQLFRKRHVNACLGGKAHQCLVSRKGGSQSSAIDLRRRRRDVYGPIGHKERYCLDARVAKPGVIDLRTQSMVIALALPSFKHLV